MMEEDGFDINPVSLKVTGQFGEKETNVITGKMIRKIII